jgi:poly-gamma-glutamate synthesis protein (capsule biosynthesis protein)
MAGHQPVVRASVWWQMKRILIGGLGAVIIAVIVYVGAQRAVPLQEQVLPTVEYANTYDSPQQFMEGIYAAEQKIKPPKDQVIRGLIVPHHLTATETLASGFKMLQGQSFKKIVLLSPDHFGGCQNLLCTVNGTYHTLFGDVHASTSTVQALLESPLVSENQKLFVQEHGIFAVLPYIVNYFPGVEVTPLVLSQRLPWRLHQKELLDIVSRAVDEDTLLVVSSDFSHYLPLKTAEEMDAKTITAINAEDLGAIESLKQPDQSDCPGCVWALASLAKERGFYHPEVVMHTNSATILKEPEIPSTTSHFSIVWYEKKDP